MGGHLEIYCDSADKGRAILESGRELPRNKILNIDHNHDNAVNLSELTSFLDTYRRNSYAGTQGRSRTLAVVA